jgi:hypothetical protein
MDNQPMEAEESRQRQAALVAEYARLLNKGFPKDEMAKYDAKLAELPENERQKVNKLTHLSDALKSALTGRDHHRPR